MNQHEGLHKIDTVQRKNEFIEQNSLVPTAGMKIKQLEKIAPFTVFIKTFIDPIIVAVFFYLIHFIFGSGFSAPYIIMCVITFLLTLHFLDGTLLFLPNSKFAKKEFVKFLVSWSIIVMTLVVLGKVTDSYTYFHRSYFLFWIVTQPIVLIAMHWGMTKWLNYQAVLPENTQKSVIVGANMAGMNLRKAITTNKYVNQEFVGYFDDREIDRLPGVSADEILGDIVSIKEYIKQNHIDNIYISLPMSSQPRVLSILDDLKDSTLSVYFVPDFFVSDLIQAKFDYVANVPVVCICESPFKGINSVWKRITDVIISGLILAMIWPIMLVVACAVKMTSQGPVLFKQKRYGADGHSINVYKFRSMTVMEDGDSVKQATKNDNRLTPIGGFLRKSSLDELPQFLNVLEGTMSIVGPRPHANAHNEYYRKLIKGYMIRHKVKPGITGWAQVNGFRGETDTLDKMEQRIKFDLDYLRNWSLWMDLKIIFLTVSLVLKRKNAY